MPLPLPSRAPTLSAIMMVPILRLAFLLAALALLGACTAGNNAPEETLPPAEGAGRTLDIAPRQDSPTTSAR